GGLNPFDAVELRITAAEAAGAPLFVTGRGAARVKQVAPMGYLDVGDVVGFGFEDIPHPAGNAEILGGEAEQAQALGEIELGADAAKRGTMSGRGRLLHS